MDLEALTLPLNVADKAFKTGIAGALAGVTALVGAMGLAIKTAFNWAGELDQIGDIMGVTNEQAAALNFTLRKSGTETTALTRGMTILEKGLIKSDGAIDVVGKSLLNFGINFKDANGKVKDQATLISDISKRYNEFGTQQEKVNFLTEVFGKSGAELIDFFDVLASEGGIDAVSEKVKAFGLAIDPARYEQFTRNLNELKLIGTGVAVMFTEQMMPSLEAVLGWATRFAAAPIEDKFKMLADPLKLLFNMTDWFKQATDSVDWATVSQELATKINNIDWNLVGSYVRTGFKNIFGGLGTIFEEVDWGALGTALAGASNEMFAGLMGWESFDALRTDVREGMDTVKETFMEWTLANPLGDIIAEWIGNAFGYALTGERMERIIAEGLSTIQNRINSFFDNFNIVGNTPTRGSPPGRASGGPVIGGQPYNVAEFFRPEVFTPQSSGRIQPMQPAYASAGVTDADLQRLGDYFARALRAELQKSGRR